MENTNKKQDFSHQDLNKKDLIQININKKQDFSHQDLNKKDLIQININKKQRLKIVYIKSKKTTLITLFR